jgi:mono/diheme cytochrome c family protein
VLALSGMLVFVVSMVVLTMVSNIPNTSGESGLSISSVFQFLSGLLLPGLALAVLVGLAFLAQKTGRSFSRLQVWTAGITSSAMLVMGILVVVLAPPVEAQAEVELAGSLPEQILAGQDLYSEQCVECHGAEGEGGEIKGVEGMEGVVLDPINASDVMYTFTDETFYNIIGYGQPDLGMPPFGKAFGGELSPSQIDYMVAFMRYTWDDRAELPAEVAAANALPALGPEQVPSYDVHVAPLFKRYCISCHRPGKKNNNYNMRDFAEVMTSGDNAATNIIPGDPNSNLLRMINREEIEAGGPMPPTRALKPEIIDIITRWILAGAPQTAEDAAALQTAPTAPPPVSATPEGAATPTP